MGSQRLDVIYTPSGRAGEYADKGYAVNLYTGCPHACVYCYAKDCLHMKAEDFHREAKPKKDILKRLERDLEKLGKVEEPIFLCFTCDPYPLGQYNSTTRQALRLIKASGNNVRILTKNGRDAAFDFDLLDSKDEFGVTLVVGDDSGRRTWEPNSGTVHWRIDALKNAFMRSIKTWASFEPVVDTKQTLALIRIPAPFLDTIKVGKLNHENRLPEEFRRKVAGIDWAVFAIGVKALLDSIGKPYVIKQDLAAYLPGSEVQRG